MSKRIVSAIRIPAHKLIFKMRHREPFRNKICRFVARHLPDRLIYFVVIWVGAQCSSANNKPVPDITWQDMAKHYEKRDY